MDPFVELARLAVNHYTRHRCPPVVPATLRQALGDQRAATFVSLHGPEGELRGCKGTLEPWRDTVADEIVDNAISACSKDPRFPPVRTEELEGLRIHVDVLSALEPIRGPEDLDPKRYGLLVSTPDGRRGVLLPDLEGVTVVSHQIAIACRKAGIEPGRERFAMARFTTIRHAGATVRHPQSESPTPAPASEVPPPRPDRGGPPRRPR